MVDLAPLLLLLTAAAEVWLPVCACHPPAPHAARMDGYATTAASGLMGLIFSLSTFGEGKRYPGWFLPIAAAHEAATVAALASGKTGLALVGSCGFLGGVAYTNFNPMDGMVWAKGPKSVIPLTVAGGATAVVASSCTGAVDVSLAAGMAMLAEADISGVWATLQNPPHWVLGAAAIGGATLGLILHLGLGTCQVADPPEAAAKKSE